MPVNKFFICLLAGCLSASSSAFAFQTKAKQAFLVDFETGTPLLEKDADLPMPPASMSKLMTAYMIFDRLRLPQKRKKFCRIMRNYLRMS